MGSKLGKMNQKNNTLHLTLCFLFNYNYNQQSDSEYRVISTQQSARSSALFPSQALSALKELAPSAN